MCLAWHDVTITAEIMPALLGTFNIQIYHRKEYCIDQMDFHLGVITWTFIWWGFLTDCFLWGEIAPSMSPNHAIWIHATSDWLLEPILINFVSTPSNWRTIIGLLTPLFKRQKQKARGHACNLRFLQRTRHKKQSSADPKICHLTQHTGYSCIYDSKQ